MTPHGEDFSIASWRGLHAAREMRAVVRQSKVCHHVLRWQDGKSRLQQVVCPKNAFVVFLSAVAVVAAHAHEVAAIFSCLHHIFYQATAVFVVEEGIVALPFVDDSAPRCPSPDGEGGGEEVTVGYVLSHLVNVETAYHHYTLIVFVAVEQFLAEREERLRRHVIIFQYDALVGNGEGPFLR